MELFDVIVTVYIIAAFILFGASCAFMGYKKGTKKGEMVGHARGARFICDEIRRIIKEPDPLVKTVAWIPTEERPPKKAGRYLVHIKDFAYATDLYYDERDGFYDEYDDGERVYYSVVHWAEFPEIPDGSEGTEEWADKSPPLR